MTRTGLFERVELSPECVLYLGDCRAVLHTLDGVDAIVTDPPYSSGGQFRGDRTQPAVKKYVNTDSEVGTTRSDFTGDNRDQRSFLAWCSLWMSEAHAATNHGGIICCFTDWRQLPTMTDAIQCAGWVWRNLATWWKPGCRMQRGRFSSSAEYVVYGSRGVPLDGEFSPQNVFSFPTVSGDDKEHIAEKPLEVLRWILGTTRSEDTVVDPFMGSGTTGIACLTLGRKFIGIEIDPHYFNIARKRLERELAQGKLDFATAP